MSASIANALWLNTPETRAVMAALDTVRPDGSRFVGGCVRNALMGKDVDDIDIATQLLPEQTIEAGKRAGLAAHPTGIEHGTITLVCNHVPFEVTTLRRDVSTDGRRASVAFTEDWAEDAQRRDFRMNALYADGAGNIFDPTGGGIDDIAAGRVVFIGDGDTRLREDFLRALRFFRFSAWYGKGPLDAEGLAACERQREGLKQLSGERIWKELKKLMGAPDPRVSLKAMAEIGVAGIAFGEGLRLDRSLDWIGVEEALALMPDAMTRIAAALADAESARALARRLKLSNDERDRLVAALNVGAEIKPDLTPRAVRALVYRIGREAFIDRARLAWAKDGLARSTEWRALVEIAATWERPKLPLSGEDVTALGVPRGPKVGQVIRAVEDWWVEADFPDDAALIKERANAFAIGDV